MPNNNGHGAIINIHRVSFMGKLVLYSVGQKLVQSCHCVFASYSQFTSPSANTVVIKLLQYHTNLDETKGQE